MKQKYELTNISIHSCGTTLYRIRALKKFNGVKKGELGGYVESEENLSQEGSCWIEDSAMVFGHAKVYENAIVYGNAIICGHAKVYGNAIVHGDTQVDGNAEVFGNAEVHGNSMVCGHAIVYDNAQVDGDARVYENSKVYGHSMVCGNAKVYGNAIVYGDTQVVENSRVYENAEVCGNVIIRGAARISRNSLISSYRCWALADSFGSAGRPSTFFRCKDGLVRVNCGCFFGTLDEFRKKVKETHCDNKYAKEYLALADLMELRFSE